MGWDWGRRRLRRGWVWLFMFQNARSEGFTQKWSFPCFSPADQWKSVSVTLHCDRLGTFSPPSIAGRPQESLALLFLNVLLAMTSLAEPKLQWEENTTMQKKWRGQQWWEGGAPAHQPAPLSHCPGVESHWQVTNPSLRIHDPAQSRDVMGEKKNPGKGNRTKARRVLM